MNKIITNKEIKDKFPQIKFFINSWATRYVDSNSTYQKGATRIIILCSQGIKGECEAIVCYESKKQAINLYKKHLFDYIGVQLATTWKYINKKYSNSQSNCLIWREKPSLEKDDRGVFVYSRLLVTFVDIEE